MRLNKIVSWTCPICNHVNKFTVDDGTPDASIERCNSDEGGCDNRMVIDVFVTVMAIPHIIAEPIGGQS